MDYDFLNKTAGLNNISPEKLNFLLNFANSQKPSDMKDMAPFLLSTLNSARKENIQFTPSETELLVTLLKKNMSAEEAAKADKIIRLMNERKSGH